MIIAFAIISLMIISWLSIGIYAIFIPFMQNISDIQSYNSAYYGAIAATERALLVAKQQKFWFNGSWWRKWSTQWWPIIDYSDPSMGILAQENNGIQWEIRWRTTRIPQEGKWNIPQIFAANDSRDFNNFGIQDSIFIKTEINNTNNPEEFYEETNNNIQPARSFIDTQRRIPPYIQDGTTGLLCDTNNIICNTDSTIDNNIIVFWQRRGLFAWSEFLIIPTTQTFKIGELTYAGDNDMHIRESIINGITIPTIRFADRFNPLSNSIDTTEHTTIWPWGDDIKSIVFTGIFSTPEIEELYLQYTITQPPISRAWFVYPFLEYAIISDKEMSDTHRHIQWQSTVGKYEVKMQIDKPQNERTQWSSFTIIF